MSWSELIHVLPSSKHNASQLTDDVRREQKLLRSVDNLWKDDKIQLYLGNEHHPVIVAKGLEHPSPHIATHPHGEPC